MNRRKLNGDHNQCAGCGEFFNSTLAFEKHRVGEHAGNQRRCLTTAEMEEKGMAVSSSGWWVSSPMPKYGAEPACDIPEDF